MEVLTMKVINLAVETYGESQLDIVIEEMAELIKEIVKYKRVDKKDDFKVDTVIHNLTSEIADVEIMLEQLKILLNIKQSKVQEVKEFKLKRLEQRIHQEKYIWSKCQPG